MSGGERQMVAVGRAMMSAPSILMLDEPSLGLAPLVCSELFRSLARIKETGVGIFLVEQNAKQSLAIADRGYLLDNGHIVGVGQRRGAVEGREDQEGLSRWRVAADRVRAMIPLGPKIEAPSRMREGASPERRA